MRADEFNAVTFDGEVYCMECLPSHLTIESEGVSPIFACEEWDVYPVCACGIEHDYVNLSPIPESRLVRIGEDCADSWLADGWAKFANRFDESAEDADLLAGDEGYAREECGREPTREEWREITRAFRAHLARKSEK